MQEKRRFQRVQLDVPTELHQGSTSWQVQLIDISLNGIAVSRPDNWDADYSHPFSFILSLPEGDPLELFAHVVHIESVSLGFQLEALQPEQLAPLSQLLASKLDSARLNEEIALLDS